MFKVISLCVRLRRWTWRPHRAAGCGRQHPASGPGPAGCLEAGYHHTRPPRVRTIPECTIKSTIRDGKADLRLDSPLITFLNFTQPLKFWCRPKMMGWKKNIFVREQTKNTVKMCHISKYRTKKKKTNQLSLRLEGFGIKNREALNVTWSRTKNRKWQHKYKFKSITKYLICFMMGKLTVWVFANDTDRPRRRH